MQKKIVIQKSLKNYLESKNLSQGKLASASGISLSSLHGYLNGTLPKSLIILIKLAESMGIGLDELAFGKSPISQEIDTNSLWEITGKYELIIKKEVSLVHSRSFLKENVIQALEDEILKNLPKKI